jgi:predicted CoA-binding protein
MELSASADLEQPSLTRAAIDAFLELGRIAVVGVSRADKDFSRGLFRELLKRGYDVVPVNPNAAEIEGRRCYARVQEIPAPVEGVLVMTPAEVTPEVIQDCIDAGVDRVWMHKGAGVGAVNPEAVAMCEEHGIIAVAGYCPFMFLPNTGFVHRIHRFFKKMGKSYPN